MRNLTEYVKPCRQNKNKRSRGALSGTFEFFLAHADRRYFSNSWCFAAVFQCHHAAANCCLPALPGWRLRSLRKIHGHHLPIRRNPLVCVSKLSKRTEDPRRLFDYRSLLPYSRLFQCIAILRCCTA